MKDPSNTPNRTHRDRVQAVERLLTEIDPNLHEYAYPVTRADLNLYYATSEMSLPTETESLGDVSDRVNETNTTPQEARETIFNDLMTDILSESSVDRQQNYSMANGQLGSVESGLESNIDEPPAEFYEDGQMSDIHDMYFTYDDREESQDRTEDTEF